MSKAFLLGGIGALLLGITACSSFSERFRTRALTKTSIQYKDLVRWKVTGIGCALDLETAVRISRNTAQYNLRSILGNTRYRVSFQEIARYEEDDQICVETEIESHAP